MWNPSESRRSFTLTLEGGLVAAGRVTHIETDLESAAVGNRALSARIEASQMLTFRLTEQPRRVDKRPAAAGSAGR